MKWINAKIQKPTKEMYEKSIWISYISISDKCYGAIVPGYYNKERKSYFGEEPQEHWYALTKHGAIEIDEYKYRVTHWAMIEEPERSEENEVVYYIIEDEDEKKRPGFDILGQKKDDNRVRVTEGLITGVMIGTAREGCACAFLDSKCCKKRQCVESLAMKMSDSDKKSVMEALDTTQKFLLGRI